MLYLITNRKLVLDGIDIYDVIKGAVQGGVDSIILREKDLSYDELLHMAIKIKGIICDTKTMLTVNGNLRVAENSGADGYHTTFDEFVALRPKFSGIIGVSAHSIEEVKVIDSIGADYILLSHIFNTSCKQGVPPKGISLIREAKNITNISIVGLGGIDHTNSERVIEAGGSGVAVMSYILGAVDPYVATTRLKGSMSNFYRE